jgi:hypothetical protein
MARHWDVHPERCEASSDAALVRFRLLRDGSVQVYLVAPHQAMDEAEAGIVAAEAQRAIGVFLPRLRSVSHQDAP